MATLLPLWANILLVGAFVSILLAAVLIRKKCEKCGAVLEEVSASDPLTWHGITITRIPRFRTVRYHCARCNSDSVVKELTGGPA